MAEDQPKRPGRPMKYPGQGRRPSLSLRVRGGLCEKLKAAADMAERTVSEEMERRLEDSFGPSDSMKSALRDVLREAMQPQEPVPESEPKPEASGAWFP